MRDRHRSSFEKNLLDRTHHDTHRAKTQWGQIFGKKAKYFMKSHYEFSYICELYKQLPKFFKSDRAGGNIS